MTASRRSGERTGTDRAVVIDDVDKAIIEQLQQDGRLPYTKLGAAVGLSEAAVRQRVQRLVESGVVQIVAVTDPLTLGFRREAMIGLKIEGDLRGVADTIAVDPRGVLRRRRQRLVRPPDGGRVRGRRPPARAAQRQGALHPRSAQHRDVHLSPPVQADLRMGYPIVDDERRSTRTTSTACDDLAHRHLWMHFSRLGAFADAEVPIMAEGEGCYLWDARGKRYLDALSGLFTVQLGHGRAELAEAARDQAETLEYFPIWSYAHPPAIELAAKLAELAPGDLNRVFFTTGGSEAVESAWKLARQYFRAIGQPERYKVIARETAYHGTTMGALAITGVPALREPFEPLTPGHVARDEHEPLPPRARGRRGRVHGARRPTRSSSGSSPRVPRPSPRCSSSRCRTRAAASCRPRATSSASARSATGTACCSCPTRSSARSAGSARCSARERYDYLPDMITCAKGLTSGYSPLGAVICRDFLAEPFLSGARELPARHHVRRPPGQLRGRAAQPRALRGGGHPRARAGATRPSSASRIEGLRDVPIVGDVRGAGYFLALELVADPDTDARFTKPQGEALLRGFLAPRLYEAGLICRTDDRGDPVVQLSPPLIAGPEEFDDHRDRRCARCLTEAWKRMQGA